MLLLDNFFINKIYSSAGTSVTLYPTTEQSDDDDKKDRQDYHVTVR